MKNHLPLKRQSMKVDNLSLVSDSVQLFDASRGNTTLNPHASLLVFLTKNTYYLYSTDTVKPVTSYRVGSDLVNYAYYI